MKSSALVMSFWISSSCLIHSSLLSISLVPVFPSLYFQWAAMPFSAVWCISQVRI